MIHRRILITALAVLAATLLAPTGVLAAKHHGHQPHRYAPKGKHCRKGYRKVYKGRSHHRRLFCVKRAKHKPRLRKLAPPAKPLPALKLHSHLDPSFVRDPNNPFLVTYAYSASASESTDDFATQEVAPLPSGVLSLYSDGQLECAINVGSGVEGSECPVEYAKLGQHKVTTIYTSGEESATETETETIEPLATTTTLSVSYEGFAEAETTGDFYWQIGVLKIEGGASPGSGAITLGCREDEADCLAVPSAAIELPVIGKQCGAGPARNAEPLCEVQIGSAWYPVADLEAGDHFLRASAVATAGYLSSEATAPVQFTPTLNFPACDAEHTGPWC